MIDPIGFYGYLEKGYDYSKPLNLFPLTMDSVVNGNQSLTNIFTLFRSDY